jgi:hypothetical protein
MKRLVILLFAFLVLFSSISVPDCLADTSWHDIGPFGGTVRTIVIDPTNTQTVYAGTQDNGIYKSINGGASWTSIGKGVLSTLIMAIAIDPSNSQTLYTNGFGVVYKSTDGGTTWSGLPIGVSTSVYSIAVDHANSQIVYAGANNGIFKTIDGGKSWVSIYNKINTAFLPLSVDQSNSKIIYAGATYSNGSTGSGLYKSIDGGVTWAANAGVSNTIINSLAIDPTDSRIVYVGTANGIFKSTNGGTDWASINSTAGGTIVIDPSDHQKIYVAVFEKVIKSNDGGGTWTSVYNKSATSFMSLALDPTASQTLYVGAWSGDISKTTNGGASWQPVDMGIADTNVRSLAIHPAAPQTIYAGTYGRGVFKSTNGGASWVAVNNGMWVGNASFYTVAIDPTNYLTLYASAGGSLYKTVNGALSWSAIGANTVGNVGAIAIDQTNSQLIYVGTSNGSSTKYEIFKSSDGGASWTSANSGIPLNTTVRSLAIDPNNNQTIYAGTDGQGVFKSTDGGNSWVPVNNGLVTNDSVYSIILDPTNSLTIYLATWSNGLYVSKNGGIAWTNISAGITSTVTIALDPMDSKSLYVGTINYKDKIIKSNNGGTSWSGYSSQMSDNPVWCLSIDPSNNQTVYAATDRGVFKSLLSASFPVLQGERAASFIESTPGVFHQSSSGWPSPIFSVTGVLPTGLALDAASGGFSGTPAVGSAGTYPLIITASNGIPPDAVGTLTLTVLPASSLLAAITAPVKSSNLSSLVSITGTASGSNLSKVELQVTDGYYYLQNNGTFALTPTWLTATGTTSWSLDTSMVAWREGILYTLQARATDGSTASAPTSSNFTITVPTNKNSTVLSLTLTSDILRAGETTTISGSLVRADTSTVAGQTVTLLFTPPPTLATPNPAPIVTALTTDNSGNFTSGALSQFATPGVYLVQARFAGTSTLAASFASQTLGVTPQSGYAIIVVGEASDQSLLAEHSATADGVYNTLVNKRGFLPANISYLKSTVSAAITKQQIQYAISQMKAKNSAAPAPFYLFMIDHGSQDGFVLGNTTPSLTLTPADLAPWLDDFESGLSSDTLSAFPRFLIIGSCYSGEFVSQLSKPGRVIITSAGADEQSLAGFSTYNSATGTTFYGGEYFIDNMINFLGRGDNFKDAVMESSSNVALRDPRKVALGMHSGVYDTLAQHPLLDDNGDGNASYMPLSTTNGVLAANLSLGVGIRSLGEPADITAVTGTAILQTSQTDNVPLWLQVNDNSRIAKAWMEIRTPITSVSSNGGTGQVIPQLITQPLFYDGIQWNGSYSFPNAGTYKILYYTQDNQTGDISPTAHSTVYRQLANNTAPESFSLSSPADQGSVGTMFPLTWQEVASNNSITYTLLVATDQNFTNTVYQEVSIPQAATYVAFGKLINPANNTYYCRNGDTYCYWKVQAIDSYGAVTESNTRSFTVVATNGLPALLKGYVRDSITGAPIAGAQVVAGSGTVSTLSNGFYLTSVFNSSVNLSISAFGHQPKTLSNVSTPAGKVVSNDFTLNTSGANKPGDCDGNGTVTISEVQSAINMFLGLKPVQVCVDQDNSKVVSISEVQKVINAFLGI